MVSAFQNLGLLPPFVQAVEQLGFEIPTPIQLAAIPALLNGRNVVGQAQTGTGKTAAFALPILQQIEAGKGHVQALVLAPTRELAIQVAEAFNSMARNTGLKVLPVYGGQSYSIQVRQLERGVDVVVGTPGRLLDLLRQKILNLSQVKYLVLDEADEMLEMGFIDDVESILAQIPAERQIALFSATLPNAIRKLADRYMVDPQQISINPTRPTVAETEQHFCKVRDEYKLDALSRLLEAEEVKSALIFARTKARAQDLADELIRRGYPAASLHGDLNQARREYVLNRFRKNDITLLVATDVAARGLDIEDVSHVFNYDVPSDAEDYVHRIGRTGRAGRKGMAITFITPRERGRLKEIEAYTRLVITETRIPGREQIQARRDAIFIERLTGLLGKGTISHERALIAQLEETSFDLVDIAAAAIRLARSGETALPEQDINEPADTRPTRERRASSRGSRFEEQPSNPRDARKPARKGSRETQSEPDARFVKGSHSPEGGMVRLRMNLGNVHGVRPGDVVGAIAGEVGIPGRAIGEIDIRKDFTFVDVDERHVRQVLAQSGGQYSLRGKPVLLTLAS